MSLSRFTVAMRHDMPAGSVELGCCGPYPSSAHDFDHALTNGKYKSCLHRAVVKKESERRSLAFFLCPSKEKTVRPPEELVRRDGRSPL
ncbi:Gibberellin 20 oxidase 3 [Nymphaea thermarum]|nr:Gibberellin 20 oxidase 3 [Nymphaea thermarum]